MADYEWDTFNFTGEPLTTIFGGFITANATVAEAMADILNLQAYVLDLIAVFMIDIENPFAIIAEVLIALLENFLSIMTGDFHVLVIHPLSLNDKFGPGGFVNRVTTSIDDLYDPHRPQFIDDASTTIEGGVVSNAGSGVLDYTAWRGFVNSVYMTVSSGSLDLSGEADGDYLIIVDANGAVTSLNAGLFLSGVSVPDFSALPSPEDISSAVDALLAAIRGAGFVTWTGASLAMVHVTNGAVTIVQDLRVLTPTVSMLVLYQNATDLTALYSAVSGLTIFFRDKIALFENMVTSAGIYVAREQLTAVPVARRFGRPPNWASLSPIALLGEFLAPLRQMLTQFRPEPSASDFLTLLADTLRANATALDELAERLNSIAYLLANSGFSMSRFWMPLSYGGNTFIKNVLNATSEELTRETTTATDVYSFGVVMVAGAPSYPALNLFGGINPLDGGGVPLDVTPNIVSISGSQITVGSP